MTFIIGVDIGSQSAKGVLVGPDARIRASAKAEYRMQHPNPGWAEQDPEQYLAATASVVRSLLSNSHIAAGDVSHLAFASQVDGLVAIDADCRPLGSAIMWLDRRAVVQTGEFSSALDHVDVFARTGLNVDASHTAPKMMWLRDTQPEVYHKAHRLVSIGGYLVARTTGRAVQDHAQSSSSLLYDIRDGRWDHEIVEAVALDSRQLPEIDCASAEAGFLRAETADLLGLTTRCRVMVGTGDDHAAALGAGGNVPGHVIDIIGTAEPIAVASSSLVLDPTRSVETHAHAVRGRFLIENPGFVSGGNSLWFASRILGITQSEFFAAAERSTPGAAGVRFLPTLSGATTPRWNAAMRGAFCGLGMGHEASDLARAILEANAFAFRDVVESMSRLGLADSIRTVGGGTRSDLWMRIKATLVPLPVHRVLVEEPTALGAAMLAAVAAEMFPTIDDAVDELVRIDPEPVAMLPGTSETYEVAYREYRALFDAVESMYTQPSERTSGEHC